MREGTPASEPARGWYPSTRIGRRMATRDLCHVGLVAVTVGLDGSHRGRTVEACGGARQSLGASALAVSGAGLIRSSAASS